jgi:hypothetical protein
MFQPVQTTQVGTPHPPFPQNVQKMCVYTLQVDTELCYGPTVVLFPCVG